MAGITRRDFLQVAAAAAVSASFPNFVAGNSRNRRDWRAVVLDRDRWLHVYRPRSDETAKVCYYRKGRGWQRQGYDAMCHMLRDVEYEQTTRISPKLLDLLFIIQQYLRANGHPYVLHILSGYRTPEHNAKLKGAATNSLHIKGLAADIFVPGLPVDQLTNLVKAIGVGGVGIYQRKKFVHVDVGDVRTWTGSTSPSERAVPQFNLGERIASTAASDPFLGFGSDPGLTPWHFEPTAA